MGENTLREVLKRRSEDTQRRIMRRREKGRPRKRKGPRGGGFRRFIKWVLILLILGVGAYSVYLDRVVTTQFEKHRWSVPARVYARPLELYPGRDMTVSDMVREFRRLGYERDPGLDQPGTFTASSSRVRFRTREFRFWDGSQPSLSVTAGFSARGLDSLRHSQTGEHFNLVRMEPPLIGSIFPAAGEDRILVRLENVPQGLKELLIAVEDRRFYEHFGVDFRGIARAVTANVSAGRISQGASTLTQQLARSYFLTNEVSWWRKFNEAVMALSLELHYDKPDILGGYINKAYLGQDGSRAIHGFGLGSYFYFQKPLAELDLHETALLVGLVKGPSHYDPRKHPDRARERRNLVLEVGVEQGVIDEAVARRAAKKPLGVVDKVPQGTTYYPAFMDLVREQLRRDYDDHALHTEGLQIFTTLDPEVQKRIESALPRALDEIERSRGGIDSGSLEAAAVVTSVEGNEVLGMVGGRDARYAGFNRALSAVRSVGSLIKPAVYLTAFSRTDRFSPVTTVKDRPVEIELPDGKLWVPENFEKRYHGDIPLFQALVHSYNVPTVRIGLQVGVDNVARQIERLGYPRTVNAYPSILLGSVAMAPIEVAQVYNTIATGGFRAPVNAVREVLDADGQPLKRNELSVRQSVDPVAAYQVTRLMQLAVDRGTGRGLGSLLHRNLRVAGKTGTTSDYRDSWFAGFTNDRLAVTWVGRDDNQPAGLTGAAGALRVWGRIMDGVATRPLDPVKPEEVVEAWIDSDSGLKTDADCAGAVLLPFRPGQVPAERAPCRGGYGPSAAGGW